MRGLALLVVTVTAAAGVLFGPMAAHASTSTVYQIFQKFSGTCVDVRDGNTVAGVTIQQYSCNQSGAQQWQLVPSDSYAGAYQIENADGMCMGDVSTNGTTLGVGVQQIYCNVNLPGGAWQLIGPYGPAPGGWYLLQNLQNNGCLDNNFSTQQSTTLVLNTCALPTPGGGGNYDQQWQFNSLR